MRGVGVKDGHNVPTCRARAPGTFYVTCPGPLGAGHGHVRTGPVKSAGTLEAGTLEAGTFRSTCGWATSDRSGSAWSLDAAAREPEKPTTASERPTSAARDWEFGARRVRAPRRPEGVEVSADHPAATRGATVGSASQSPNVISLTYWSFLAIRFLSRGPRPRVPHQSKPLRSYRNSATGAGRGRSADTETAPLQVPRGRP